MSPPECPRHRDAPSECPRLRPRRHHQAHSAISLHYRCFFLRRHGRRERPLLADVEAYRKTMFDYPRTELDPLAESMFNLNHDRPWYWALVAKDDVPAGKTRGDKDAKSIYCLRCHRPVQCVDDKRKSVDTRWGNKHMEAAHEDDLLRFKTEYETFHLPKPKKRNKRAARTPSAKTSATTAGEMQQLLAAASPANATGVAARTSTANDAASDDSTSTASIAASTEYWGNPYWVDRRKGKRVRDLDTEALEACWHGRTETRLPRVGRARNERRRRPRMPHNSLTRTSAWRLCTRCRTTTGRTPSTFQRWRGTSGRTARRSPRFGDRATTCCPTSLGRLQSLRPHSRPRRKTIMWWVWLSTQTERPLHSPRARQKSCTARERDRRAPPSTLATMLIDCVNNAVETLCISVFCFTDDGLDEAVLAAARRGVHVRLYVDYTQAYAYPKWMRKFINSNLIEVNYRRAKTEKMHTKYLVADGEQVIVVSANFSTAALCKYNEELLIHIRGRHTASLFLDDFQYRWLTGSKCLLARKLERPTLG